MSADRPPDALSRRERQIMDVLYARGEGTAHDVLAALPDPPGYSSVRKLLAILEEKGQVRHLRKGKQYVYVPTTPAKNAALGALRGVLLTFFGGSLESAVTTMLDSSEAAVSDEELAAIENLIREAKEKRDAAG